MYYIGIDLGTSAVKLILIDNSGKIHKIVSKEYPLSFPNPGWSEQNPKDWLRETIAGLKELIADFDKNQIAGIGVGGQMHGLVVLDKDDNVIRPAILWNDGRTTKETDYLNEVIGKDKLSQYTANIAFAGFTAPKLLWMKNNEPELFKKISKVMLPKDYINYELTGVHCTDVSDASGMLLFDVEHKCWSKPMLDICSLTESNMPKIFESYEKIGILKDAYAKELGINREVTFAAGAGDNAAAAVGTGTVGEGRCNISLGTSGTIFISKDKFSVDSNNALHSFAHADGSYHLMGCILSAASCNKWWMDTILKTKEYSKEQENITDNKLGKNNVIYLPYMMGERSPHNNPLARGTFTGMTLDTSREDMTQAILEGVAFAIRDCMEVAKKLGIHITRSTMTGGGAKSQLWRKIFANVLNIDIEIPNVEEGPGYGGAMLAAVACGEYESVVDISKAFIKISDVTHPDKEITDLYEKQYIKYKALYPALKNYFCEIL